MEKPCEICGTIFYFKPHRLGRAKFCSKRCLGISNGQRVKHTGGGFPKGHVPWSKTHGKGRHFSPRTEFRKGMQSNRKLPVGSERMRKCKGGNIRAYVKIAEPNRWKLRAVIVWESIHGPLPRGHLVHHRDRDSTNDEPSNLEAMTRGEHLVEHRKDFERHRADELRKANQRRKAEGRYQAVPKEASPGAGESQQPARASQSP